MLDGSQASGNYGNSERYVFQQLDRQHQMSRARSVVGNQAYVRLAKFCCQLLDRNRIFETDCGLDAEVAAERHDVVQIIAGTDDPEPDERKPIMQQGYRGQCGIETESPGNCAMTDDRKWFVVARIPHSP